MFRQVSKRLPEAQMIRLYGSYATDKFVEYDEYIEFGIPIPFISDYDILVVTNGISDKKTGTILDNIDDLYYNDPDTQTPVQFINDDLNTLNRQLEEDSYFFSQLKQKGIILYNSGKFKLAQELVERVRRSTSILYEMIIW